MTNENERAIIMELQRSAVDIGDDYIALVCAKALCGNRKAWDEALDFAVSLGETLAEMDS